MTITERTTVLVGAGILGVCGILAASIFTVTHSVNHTLLAYAAVADASKSQLPTVANAATAQVNALTPVINKAARVLEASEKLLNASTVTVSLTNHRLNDLCEPGPCGTLADLNRTLATGRGTMGQLEVSARDFNRHSNTFYDQEAQSSKQLQTAMTDVDKFITAPDLIDTVHQTDAAAMSIAGTTANVDAMTSDGKVWIHQRLYPTKKRGFVSAMEAVGDFLKHFEPPLF
jgi:hypothetical protein